MNIRPTNGSDIADLQSILDATELFPSDMLPEMIGSFLSDNACEEIWLTCEHDSVPVGFCFATPEQMTVRTWNMLAIAVSPTHQSKGVGTAIVSHLEDQLRRSGQRILIVDTSGLPEFERTRNFYVKTGYTQEARIRDFWEDGDDKVTFWKKLTV